MIAGIIHQEGIMVINTYIPNIGAPKYIKQLLEELKGETESDTIMVGDFNKSFKSMKRSPRWKINRITLALNDTLD